MLPISIHLLENRHFDELFEFEIRNRAFFENMGFGRANNYYDKKQFELIQEEIIQEQAQGKHFMYLVKDKIGVIVGRVNLIDVVRSNLNKAEIGYRMGAAYQSKGYGTKAVSLAIEQAKKVHQLERLEAGTSPYNIGSQIVLIKNGFQFKDRKKQSIYHNGRWEDSILFEKVLDEMLIK